MSATHTITAPSWVIDALLLAPGIRRFTARIRRRLAHSRRWTTPSRFRLPELVAGVVLVGMIVGAFL